MLCARPARPVLAALTFCLLAGLCSFAASPATARTAEPPTGACAHRTLPPSPVDTSEKPPPGQASPAPPPVPATPPGGPRMDACGLVLPGDAPAPPETITAHSWLVQDLDTGAVLAAKDPHGRYRPASLIKTLLALVVLEQLPPDEVVVATETDADQECTCVGIVAGGEYTVDQLLHALLMRSGNDVAHTLATALGGVEVAVREMNELAARLGAASTRAATPSGLDGPGMMTSAYDMSVIFNYAMRQPGYAEAVGTKHMPFPGGPGEPDFTVYNDNKLWGSYPGFLGGKTGFTDDARHTYAGAAERDGRRIAVVMLRSEQRPIRVSEQAERLLDYGFTLAASGAAPVGRLSIERPAPSSSAPAGTTDEPNPELSAAAGDPDDPFGTTGWIVTLLTTVLVLAGLLVAHRRGLLQRPE